MDRREIIDTLCRWFEAHGQDLAAAYLFGSVARGSAREGSDVDVALLYAKEPAPGLDGLGFDVAHQLELVLGRRVDVVVLNKASPDLVHRVLKDGVLLLENDRRARVSFEVRLRAQYLDLAPLRRAYRMRRVAGVGSKGTT